MNPKKLFELATPCLEKNDFGVAHTRRVFDIAKKTFSISPASQDLTFASIILHDIGGNSIKDQYEKGPEIAASILKKMGCDAFFIQEVCGIVGTHHEHPDNPSNPFRILFDSDKLVMFSPEEFPHYDSRANFDWDKIVELIYSEKAKCLAKALLQQRKNEKK